MRPVARGNGRLLVPFVRRPDLGGATTNNSPLPPRSEPWTQTMNAAKPTHYHPVTSPAPLSGQYSLLELFGASSIVLIAWNVLYSGIAQHRGDDFRGMLVACAALSAVMIAAHVRSFRSQASQVPATFISVACALIVCNALFWREGSWLSPYLLTFAAPPFWCLFFIVAATALATVGVVLLASDRLSVATLAVAMLILVPAVAGNVYVAIQVARTA